jgi:hypothetical protein
VRDTLLRVNISSVGRFFLAGVLVIACAPRVQLPKATDIRLGSVTAPARDYRGVDVCLVDADKLPGEIDAMNALLQEFLGVTSAGAKGVWADEHLDKLEQGMKVLPSALDGYEPLVAATCSFPHYLDLPDRLRAGAELARQSRKRVNEGGALLAQLRHGQAMAKWREEDAKKQETERQAWCAAKPKPVPDIFYASQDDLGRREWHFCDGSKVVAPKGAELQFVPPTGKKAPAAVAGFIKAAKKFPDSQIAKAPPAPAENTETGGTAGR